MEKLFDLRLEFLSDYRDDPERRVWFSVLQFFAEQGTFSVCSIMDPLRLEISILGLRKKILVSLGGYELGGYFEPVIHRPTGAGREF